MYCSHWRLFNIGAKRKKERKKERKKKERIDVHKLLHYRLVWSRLTQNACGRLAHACCSPFLSALPFTACWKGNWRSNKALQRSDDAPPSPCASFVNRTFRKIASTLYQIRWSCLLQILQPFVTYKLSIGSPYVFLMYSGGVRGLMCTLRSRNYCIYLNGVLLTSLDN